MTPASMLGLVRRWWWVLVLLPLIGGVVGVMVTRNQPFSSTVRATVLLPGDTEDTGSAERPELMILDDVPAFIHSIAFAQLVHDQLIADGITSPGVTAIRDALSGSRYSRVVTITAKTGDAALTKRIADAAGRVLPDAVNQYLIADGAPAASVRIIDPASDPVQNRMGRISRVVVQAAAAFVLACVVAFLLDTTTRTPGQARAETIGQL